LKKLINYFITLLLWILSIVLWATGVFPWLCIGLLVLHFTELIVIGYRTGRAMNRTPATSIVMCMLFGFIWWLPLRRDMKADEFTEDDFMEDGLEPWRESQMPGAWVTDKVSDIRDREIEA